MPHTATQNKKQFPAGDTNERMGPVTKVSKAGVPTGAKSGVQLAKGVKTNPPGKNFAGNTKVSNIPSQTNGNKFSAAKKPGKRKYDTATNTFRRVKDTDKDNDAGGDTDFDGK